MWLRSAPARASMHGRSAAPMHVKCIGDNSASPSRPDQHLTSLPIKVILLRSHATLAEEVVFHTRMAHPSPVRLWACAPKGSRTGMCATGPRDRKSRRASAGTQSRGGEGKCAIRGVLSLVSLARAIRGAGPAGALCAPNFAPGKIVFARAKTNSTGSNLSSRRLPEGRGPGKARAKETRPRCGEPQLLRRRKRLYCM